MPAEPPFSDLGDVAAVGTPSCRTPSDGYQSVDQTSVWASPDGAWGVTGRGPASLTTLDDRFVAFVPEVRISSPAGWRRPVIGR